MNDFSFKPFTLRFIVFALLIIMWARIHYSNKEIISQWRLVNWEIVFSNKQLYDDWWIYETIIRYECWGITVERFYDYSEYEPKPTRPVKLYCKDSDPYNYLENSFFSKHEWLFVMIFFSIFYYLPVLIIVLSYIIYKSELKYKNNWV